MKGTIASGASRSSCNGNLQPGCRITCTQRRVSRTAWVGPLERLLASWMLPGRVQVTAGGRRQPQLFAVPAAGSSRRRTVLQRCKPGGC